MQNSILKIMKLLVIIIFAQIYITSALFTQLDWFTPVFGALLVLCTLLYLGGKISVPKRIGWFFIYGFFALITGVLFSPYRGTVLSSLIEYFENCVFLFILYIISREDIDFCPKLLVGISLPSAVIALRNQYSLHGRLALHASAGINTLAFVLALGVTGALILLGKGKKRGIENLLLIGIIVFNIYEQMLIGARKYFLISCFSVVAWIFLCLRKRLKEENKNTSWIKYVVILIIIGIGVYEFLPQFLDSSVYARLSGAIDRTQSDQARLEYYRISFQMLKENPISGLGFDSFKMYNNGITSHSTYAELWSGTGIVGTILFFVPVLKILFDNLSFLKIDSEKVNARTNLILLIAYLLLGLGIGLQYESLFYFVLAYLISYSDRIYYDTNGIRGDIKHEYNGIY